MSECPAPHAPSAEHGCSSGPASLTSVLEALSALTLALQHQTQAITQLAQSNESLIQAMLESGDLGDDISSTYMDGSAIR